MGHFTLLSTGFRKPLMVAMLLFATLSFTSCLKDGEETPEVVAAALFVNAVPGSEGLIVALNNNQVNNLAIGEWFRYSQYMSYRRVYPGERLLRAFHPEDVNTNEEILRTTLEFEVGEYYSLFFVGDSEESMEVVQVADMLQSPESGESKVRFVNLSPDAPALELGIVGQSELLATGKGFKEHSLFKDLSADQEYQFFIRRVGSDEVLLEFDLTPQDRFIYTICAKGFFEEVDPQSDVAFDHGVIVH